MNRIIKDKLGEIKSLCEKHRVKKLHVFGSVLGNDFGNDSDIDFLVDFQDGIEPLEQGKLWWNFYDALRNLFQKEIDLITEKKIKNPYFLQQLQNTKQVLYG